MFGGEPIDKLDICYFTFLDARTEYLSSKSKRYRPEIADFRGEHKLQRVPNLLLLRQLSKWESIEISRQAKRSFAGLEEMLTKTSRQDFVPAPSRFLTFLSSANRVGRGVHSKTGVREVAACQDRE